MENLNQLIKSLEEAVVKLEESYKQREPDTFNQSKKILIQIQNKILEEVK